MENLHQIFTELCDEDYEGTTGLEPLTSDNWSAIGPH